MGIGSLGTYLGLGVLVRRTTKISLSLSLSLSGNSMTLIWRFFFSTLGVAGGGGITGGGSTTGCLDSFNLANRSALMERIRSAIIFFCSGVCVRVFLIEDAVVGGAGSTIGVSFGFRTDSSSVIVLYYLFR